MPGAPKPLHRLLSSLVCPHIICASLLAPVTSSFRLYVPLCLEDLVSWGKFVLLFLAPVFNTRLGLLQVFIMCCEKTVSCNL